MDDDFRYRPLAEISEGTLGNLSGFLRIPVPYQRIAFEAEVYQRIAFEAEVYQRIAFEAEVYSFLG